MRIVSAGSHIHRDIKTGLNYLKFRVKLYPDPSQELLYGMHNVEHFDDKGRSLGIWLNPVMCHNIRIDENTTPDGFTNYIEKVFTPSNLKSLVGALVLPDSADRVSPFMRDKSVLSASPIVTKDTLDLVAEVNKKFKFDLQCSAADYGSPLERQTIDIGSGATDRTADYALTNRTLVDLGNSSNGTGTLDTFETWLTILAEDVVVGTTEDKGSDVYETYDSEAIVDDIASGSKQTESGMTIAVSTGFYIVIYASAGNIERDTTFPTVMLARADGEYIDPSDSTTYSMLEFQISLYATGTAGASIPIIMHHRKMMENS